MKITNEIIPYLYDIAKEFYLKKIKLKEATEIIFSNYGLKSSSSTDYIYNYGHLISGRKFTRTNNSFATNYYIERIYRENGIAELKNSVNSLEKHIKYYEGIRSTNMVELRLILNKYNKLINPPLIDSMDSLLINIETIEKYLSEGNYEEKLFASDLVRLGTCFIAYQVADEIRFCPSRFLGYQNNKLGKYSKSVVDGRETNKIINSLLNSKPISNDKADQLYKNYCRELGIIPKNTTARKFWFYKLEKDFQVNEDLSGEFPEGKIVERIHKARERNPEVIRIAKQNFKSKNGKLYCQICEFDFEDKYGELGENYIEAHHTILVSAMEDNHKTKPEDIAILCCNCHKMVHRRRPWLSLEQLSKILRS